MGVSVSGTKKPRPGTRLLNYWGGQRGATGLPFGPVVPMVNLS